MFCRDEESSNAPLLLSPFIKPGQRDGKKCHIKRQHRLTLSIRLFDILTQTAVVCLIFVVIFDFQVILSDGHKPNMNRLLPFIRCFDEFCFRISGSGSRCGLFLSAHAPADGGTGSGSSSALILECTGSASEESDDAFFSSRNFWFSAYRLEWFLDMMRTSAQTIRTRCQGVDKGSSVQPLRKSSWQLPPTSIKLPS